jgi:hypothetical protein
MSQRSASSVTGHTIERRPSPPQNEGAPAWLSHRRSLLVRQRGLAEERATSSSCSGQTGQRPQKRGRGRGRRPGSNHADSGSPPGSGVAWDRGGLAASCSLMLAVHRGDTGLLRRAIGPQRLRSCRRASSCRTPSATALRMGCTVVSGTESGGVGGSPSWSRLSVWARQGRGLTSGEAQAVDSGTGVDECAEDRPEPECLVIGMGEHGPGSGRRSSGSGWPVIGQPRAQEAPTARSAPGPAVPSSGWKSPVRGSWW